MEKGYNERTLGYDGDNSADLNSGYVDNTQQSSETRREGFGILETLLAISLGVGALFSLQSC